MQSNDTENNNSESNSPDDGASASAAALSEGDDSQCRIPQAKGESPRAFEAFRVYLELGPDRRYAAVARKVGAALGTIKRWAVDFDWRARIKKHATQCATQYDENAKAVQREQFLDAAARAKTIRDRQYVLAEAVLDAAERYLERLDDCDLDRMNFADVCRALEAAARISNQAAAPDSSSTTEPARVLRDQLAALLDQACMEMASPKGVGAQAPVTQS